MKKILAVLFAAVFVFATSLPANAHTETVYQGNDFGRVRGDSEWPNHNRVNVADRECDGRTVRAIAEFYNGDTYTMWNFGGCNTNSYSTLSKRVYRLKVCETGNFDPEQCTRWEVIT